MKFLFCILPLMLLTSCIDTDRPVNVVNACDVQVSVLYITVTDEETISLDADFVAAEALTRSTADELAVIEPYESTVLGSLVNAQGRHVLLVRESGFVEELSGDELSERGWVRVIPPEACP